MSLKIWIAFHQKIETTFIPSISDMYKRI